jgi:hypothetical protein
MSSSHDDANNICLREVVVLINLAVDEVQNNILKQCVTLSSKNFKLNGIYYLVTFEDSSSLLRMSNMKLCKQQKARNLFKRRRGFLIDSSRVVSSASFNSAITTSDVVACVGIAVAVYRLFAHVTRNMDEEVFDLHKDLLFLLQHGEWHRILESRGHCRLLEKRKALFYRLFLDKNRKVRTVQHFFFTYDQRHPFHFHYLAP